MEHESNVESVQQNPKPRRAKVIAPPSYRDSRFITRPGDNSIGIGSIAIILGGIIIPPLLFNSGQQGAKVAGWGIVTVGVLFFMSLI